jgi:hypothetical protein
LHDSGTSHAPAAARHTPLCAKPSLGHTDDAPVQRSLTSHGPAAGRHTVVAGAKPFGTHVGTPPVHDSTPVSHGLPVLHGLPATHTLHPPSTRQMLLPPQLLPGVALPMSTHAAPPVEQSIEPRRQVPASHDAPSAQLTHEPPALHTWLLPHAVPGACSPPAAQPMPASVHVCMPTRHTAAGVHEAPGLHAAQLPSLTQMAAAPQAVPTGAWPASAHTGSPVPQCVMPSWQANPVLHAAASTHAWQPPSRAHTEPLPQDVPGS